MAMIPGNVWQAYQMTVFCATVDEAEIRIRPAETHPRLDRALEARGVTTWAYITAWNPGSQKRPRQENDARHEQLKNEVKLLGLEAFEGWGEPADTNWAPEQSLLVFGSAEPDALAIGRNHGQNAIVVGRQYWPARLVVCDQETSCEVCQS